MNPITVTVVLATYNGSKYLSEAIDSILAQTRAADEIIVVDDGSTDDTPRLLQAYGAKIHVIRQANAGKPAALNHAIARAKGSHIWIFDDDDVALPHALASHVEFLQANRGVDFSFGQNYTFDGDGDIWEQARWRRAETPNLDEDTLLVALMKRCTLVFQALLVPARCFKAAGYFDETLLRAQDYDMLLKLARRFVGRPTGQTTFVWRNHTGARGAPAERHANDSRALVFRKYERQIFTSVWHDFELIDYLPAKVQANGAALGQADRVAALLQRGDIMFRHDLPHKGEQDLREALAGITTPGRQLDSAMQIVARAADIDDPVFILGARLRARCLAQAMRGQYQNRLTPYAIKGVYWSIYRVVKKRRWRDAITLSLAGVAMGFYLSIRPPLGGHRG